MTAPQSRSRWTEKEAEALLSVPLIAEFVLRSPQMLDGTQKEVADLLILYKHSGLLVSQKAQEDPLSRDERKNELWVLRAAKNGVSQLIGALRPSAKAIWCEHPRRGRIDFPTGLPPIAHGIVTVETFRPVDLQPGTVDLLLAQGSIPITYTSLSDFLNIAMQLRTVPELLRYLDARRELPKATLLRVGDERPIFEFYLLNGTLKDCSSHERAREVVEASSDRVDKILENMAEYHRFSSLMEHVGHELAIRSATCLDGLPPELLAKFDAPEKRQNYHLMQEVIADLPLRERAELGSQFAAVIYRVQGESRRYVQATARLDSRPDWIFVFGASKGWTHEEILGSMEPTMRGALAHYQKQRCLIIVDREGQGYEVAMTQPGHIFTPTEEDLMYGKERFSGLRVTSIALEGF
jgi:hypothetical protein